MRWLAVVLLLAFVPSVGAQAGGSLTFGTPALDKPTLQPDSEVGTLVVPAGFVCGSTDAWTSQGVLVLDGVAADAPGIVVTGPLRFPVPEEACRGPLSKPWGQDLKFAVTASRSAPGETEVKVALKGHVEAQGRSASPVASAVGALRVAYQGLLTARVPTTLKQGPAGAEMAFDVAVENLGNSLTSVTAEVIGDVPAGWSVVAPQPFVLESAQQGGKDTAKTVRFLVIPAANASGLAERAFHFRLTPASTRDQALQGNPVDVNVLARVEGCRGEACEAAAKALSLPVAPLLGVALLGCAVVARKAHG